MYLKEGITHMQSQLETCKNCISNKKKCDNPGSRLYDLEVSPNGTCEEWESKMKFD
jgi:hypothetical protein